MTDDGLFLRGNRLLLIRVIDSTDSFLVRAGMAASGKVFAVPFYTGGGKAKRWPRH